jgi:hypothetical protein
LINDESNLNYQPIQAPPLAEYCVSLRRVSGSATQVSSIGSDNSKFSSKGSSHGRDSVAATDATTVAMMRDDNSRFSSQSSAATTVATMREDNSRFSSQSYDAPTVAMMRDDNSRFSSQSSCHTRDSDTDTLARMRADNSTAATLARDNATFLAMMAEDEQEAQEKAKRREVPAVTVNSKTLQKEERDAARKAKEKAVREGVAGIALLTSCRCVARIVSHRSCRIARIARIALLASCRLHRVARTARIVCVICIARVARVAPINYLLTKRASPFTL